MKLEVIGTIPFSPASVFSALRDNLEALAVQMENVEQVEITAREESPAGVHQVARWQAAKQSVPAAFRPFVTRQMISWFDHADWDAGALCCSWRIEPVKFSKSFECAGTTTLVDAADGQCQIAFIADAQIHLERIAVIPKFVARRFQEPVERFIVKQLRPNFDAIIDALRAYLAGTP